MERTRPRLRLASRLEQYAQVWRVVTRPGGVRALLWDQPRSVTACQLVAALASRGIRPEAVIDVGANTGQFARAALRGFPGVTVLSIEANPEVAAAARRNLQADVDWSLVETAVGARCGPTELRLHAYSPSTSVLPATAAYKETFGRDPRERVVTVPMTTLDSVVEPLNLPQPCLLKLDVQGLEAAVLDGGRRALIDCAYVLVEISFIRAYEGEATFEQVHDRLVEAGFHLDVPLDALRGLRGEITQIDFLYTRRPDA